MATTEDLVERVEALEKAMETVNAHYTAPKPKKPTSTPSKATKKAQ
jgi:hypothetical protein